MDTEDGWIERKNIPSGERTLRPLADTFVLLDGGSDGLFRPDDPLTRREAVLAVLPLYVVPEDITDTYTADFTDLQQGTELYDAVAFLERSEYLPISWNSRAFAPDTSVKREELYQLLGEENDGQESSSVLTRGEAAEILCRILGKTSSDEQTLVTFSDVAFDHPYAPQIALAATALPVKEINISVKPGEDAAQRVKDAMKTAEEGVSTRLTVLFASGTYTLTKPININGDSYDADHLEIILRNAIDAAPVLKGSVDLSASLFSQVEGKGYYQYALPESANINGKWPEFRNLYLNGQYLKLASSEEYVFEKSLRNTKQVSGGKFTYDNWFYLDSSVFEGVTESTELQPMELCVNVEWMHKRFRIDQFHGIHSRYELAQVSVKSYEWASFLGNDTNQRDFNGKTYWLENHITLLDEPGEFFYDDEAGIIYFYPYADTDMRNATVSYPLVERLITLTHASAVTIEGLTFTGTTSTLVNACGYNGGLGGTYLGTLGATGDRGHIGSAAICGGYTKNIRVRNCTFHALGGHGIYLDLGNRNVTVKGNSFTDLAMSGIIIGRQYPVWTVENGLRNLIVDNNYVHNVGIDYPLSPGIEITRVRSLAMTHNTVIHTPYSGIMVGWLNDPNDIRAEITNGRQVEVAYNYCEDNLYAINDGAGIYLPGANAKVAETDLFMRCHDNYVKATGYYDGTYNGIYLDANASNWLVENNVLDGFATEMGPIFNQDWHLHGQTPGQVTYNNTIRNNYTTQERIFVREMISGERVEYHTTVTSRNIVLEGNRYFASAALLPDEAKAIISAAGQADAYAASRPVRDTEVVMHTSDAHITLKRGGNPDRAYVTFTITNNDDRVVGYKVVNTNAADLNRKGIADVVVLSVNGETGTRVLTLQPGETGYIEISFRGKNVAKPQGMAEFDVVKDNGWKMSFRRVLHLTVGTEQEDNSVLAPDELLDDATDTFAPIEMDTLPPDATDTLDPNGATTVDPSELGQDWKNTLLPWGLVVGTVLLVAIVLIFVFKGKTKK